MCAKLPALKKCAGGGLSFDQKFLQERRARLAAERLLEQRQRELFAAHQKLDAYARSMGGLPLQVQAEGAGAAVARKQQDARFVMELERAHSAAVMAERRLWDSVETITDGFAIFDHDMGLVVANQAYLAAFTGQAQVRAGMTFAQVLQMATDQGLVDTGDESAEAWVARVLARWQQSSVPPEVIHLTSGRVVKLSDQRARDGNIVSLALDITEATEREAALKFAQTRAEAASRAKSAFLANISHEIRTPMNGVVGMAELLCDSPLNDEQRLYADTIRSSGEALLLIINDLLDYSKIEAQKLSLRPEPFDLERCLHEVVILLQPSAQEKRVDLQIDFDIAMPTRFIGDPGRIRQVFTNLIGNAVKFTHRGHVTVRVIGLENMDGQQRFVITVEDSGIGIPKDQLDLIFDEFNQVENQANRKFEGTGLGLAITMRLVSLMNGQIWVDSVEGQGSSFGVRLTLPVAEVMEPLSAVPISLEDALVIDEQALSSAMLQRQLHSLGIKSVICRSGAEALAALETGRRFDVLLADQAPRDMTPEALAEQIRARGFDMPIVVMGGDTGDILLGDTAATAIKKPPLRSALFRSLQALSTSPVLQAQAISAPMPAPSRQMRVLAAEDNRTNQLVFGKMIKELNIDLNFAANGLEAVELYQSFQPDLVFMDISMPEMDGRDATRAIRQIEAQMHLPHVPIVALTAHAMEGDAGDIMAAGLDHYMTKPLRKSALVEHIIAHRPAGTFAPLPPALHDDAADGANVAAQ